MKCCVSFRLLSLDCTCNFLFERLVHNTERRCMFDSSSQASSKMVVRNTSWLERLAKQRLQNNILLCHWHCLVRKIASLQHFRITHHSNTFWTLWASYSTCNTSFDKSVRKGNPRFHSPDHHLPISLVQQSAFLFEKESVKSFWWWKIFCRRENNCPLKIFLIFLHHWRCSQHGKSHSRRVKNEHRGCQRKKRVKKVAQEQGKEERGQRVQKEEEEEAMKRRED